MTRQEARGKREEVFRLIYFSLDTLVFSRRSTYSIFHFSEVQTEIIKPLWNRHPAC
ncbi:hypothetical protein PN497_05980 [Sphaerospermopsis kisseleviana CS-549]|uniref:Uncharacterized protein n=1 Tax=Sphaerospermopsis kisseleviana CS-549 TaxID=3021783 RepID=A0ABT4ZNP1_9CYAN|nr:hypothetical protein [Sphaerospermopsis kisseleviana]MDB9440914.1 hypothetical protein [Sphaerospermopsis kisseleviana CS-549]